VVPEGCLRRKWSLILEHVGHVLGAESRKWSPDTCFGNTRSQRTADMIWAWNAKQCLSEKQCRLPWLENQNVGYRFLSLEHCVVSTVSLRGLPLLACNTHVEKWKWACVTPDDSVSSCEIHWNTFHVTLHGNMNNVDLVQLIAQLHIATRLPI
jgi:hypothetical protein